MRDALGGQQLLQTRRMVRLGAAATAGSRLDDRGRRRGWIGRGRQGGIAGVAAEQRLELANLVTQVPHLVFEAGDACIASQTLCTGRDFHASMLETQDPRSCADFVIFR